jgi:transcriptional regulator with GAF, ATPase, and Fis domain
LNASDPVYSTIELNASEALQARKPDTGPEPQARMDALLRFAIDIHSVSSVRAMQDRVLEFTFETLACKEGALVLSFDQQLELASAPGRQRHGGRAKAPPLSRTICDRALKACVGMLSRDTVADQALRSVDSVERDRARSLIVAPLLVGASAIGLIYLQSPEPNVFGPADLRFVTAIGSIAALAITNARRAERLQRERENENLQRKAGIETTLVGESPPMVELFGQLQYIAPAECTVLILGETGTGKELAARAIHRASGRASGPFVAINCAVLSEALPESDLFGHEKGAFTGALTRREGKLERAHGGTLFLDEIGELAPALQAKPSGPAPPRRLLRVLQEREFERVGGNRTIKVNVWIIAATNRELLADAAKGAFRSDLYYRLNVVSLIMPPLLAEHFLANAGARRVVRGLSAEACRCLIRHSWPGNVRELQNVIERAVVLGTREWILPEDLPEDIVSAASPGTSASRYQEGLARAKKELIGRALEEAAGDYREAARLLGIHVTCLYRLVRALDLTLDNRLQ